MMMIMSLSTYCQNLVCQNNNSNGYTLDFYYYICCMTPEEQELYNEIERSEFVYRKFLSKEEIKICNRMVKSGHLFKGLPDEGGATIAYFINT